MQYAVIQDSGMALFDGFANGKHALPLSIATCPCIACQTLHVLSALPCALETSAERHFSTHVRVLAAATQPLLECWFTDSIQDKTRTRVVPSYQCMRCAVASVCAVHVLLCTAEILPDLDASILMYAVLGSATGLKLICYVLCVALQNKSGRVWSTITKQDIWGLAHMHTCRR